MTPELQRGAAEDAEDRKDSANSAPLFVDIPDERVLPLTAVEMAALPKLMREIVLRERFKRLYPERFVEPVERVLRTRSYLERKPRPEDAVHLEAAR